MKNGLILIASLLAIGFIVENIQNIIAIGVIVALIAIAAVAIVYASMWAHKKATAKPKSAKSQTQIISQEPHPEEPLTDRRVMALYKLAQQILDDEKVELDEAKKLKAWFKRYPESSDDRRTRTLLGIVEEALADKELDDIEALDLFVGLSEFCDQYEATRAKQGKAQLGQVQKPNFEHPQLRPLKDIELNKEYYMEYRDFAGDRSQRNIILKSVKVNKNNQPTIGAYCKLRDAHRTFRVDRIGSLCSTETGEVFV